MIKKIKKNRLRFPTWILLLYVLHYSLIGCSFYFKDDFIGAKEIIGLDSLVIFTITNPMNEPIKNALVELKTNERQSFSYVSDTNGIVKIRLNNLSFPLIFTLTHGDYFIKLYCLEEYSNNITIQMDYKPKQIRKIVPVFYSILERRVINSEDIFKSLMSDEIYEHQIDSFTICLIPNPDIPMQIDKRDFLSKTEEVIQSFVGNYSAKYDSISICYDTGLFLGIMRSQGDYLRTNFKSYKYLFTDKTDLSIDVESMLIYYMILDCYYGSQMK